MKTAIKDLLNNRPSSRVTSDIAPKALERWNPALAVDETAENTITILDFIGEDMFGEGVTARRIAAALRDIGDTSDVFVLINSPGGDMFEGIAIYNLLKEHRGNVTVKIIGLAASAASIIAMAGDRVEISRAAFYMIHNAWICACGNRNDMRDFADYLEPFDAAMSDVYQERTGLGKEEVDAMMDRETWIGGSAAIEKGFADGYLSSAEVVEASVDSGKIAAHKLDVALAKSGMTRSERRKIVADLKGGTPSATPSSTPRATELEPLPRLEFNFDLN